MRQDLITSGVKTESMKARIASIAGTFLTLIERTLAWWVGFEPTAPCGITSFQDWPLKPLRHHHIKGEYPPPGAADTFPVLSLPWTPPWELKLRPNSHGAERAKGSDSGNFY